MKNKLQSENCKSKAPTEHPVSKTRDDSWDSHAAIVRPMVSRRATPLNPKCLMADSVLMPASSITFQFISYRPYDRRDSPGVSQKKEGTCRIQTSIIYI